MNSTNPKDLIGVKKPPLALVPPAGVIHASMAMKDGAQKYGPYNWRESDVSAMVYVHAAMRHLQQWLDGEDVAEDSGAHHLGHAIACCSIILDAATNATLIDDRPLPGKSSQLIKELTEE